MASLCRSAVARKTGKLGTAAPRAAKPKGTSYTRWSAAMARSLPVRVAPMQKDERAMGRRMLKQAAVQGYLLADANFDSNQLHDVCLERGVQLVAPPRYGFGRRRGHRRQSPARLRSLELLSNPQSSFGRALHQERNAIERYFGYLSTWSAGLQALPAWVRGHRRVHRWVQGKLIFTALRRRCQKTTYVTR